MSRKLLACLTFSLAVSMMGLQGCSKPIVQDNSPVFFPPPPDEPRVQFLKTINGSDDFGKKESTFSLIVTGKEESDKKTWLRKPYGVTVHKGKIYVCDLAGRIVVIDPENEKLDLLHGGRLVGMVKPLNMAFDDEDNLYVADSKRQEILVYAADGRYLRAIGKAPDFKPADLAVEGDLVYVANMAAHEIRIFHRLTGEMAGKIEREPGKETFSLPLGLAMRNGILYATNITSTVAKVDRDGNYLDGFGKMGDGFSDLVRPKGIAVDDENRIYVVDNGMQAVKLFNSENRLLLVFGYPGLPRGSLNLPVGIAVSKDVLPYFQKYADPSFEVEYLIFVTNQYGLSKLSVYGLGHRRGGSGG